MGREAVEKKRAKELVELRKKYLAKKGKKPAAKKDEKPPKPIMWEGEKRPAPSTTLDLVRNAVSSYNQPVFPKNLKQDSCNTGVMPFIIKEVFMPPDAP